MKNNRHIAFNTKKDSLMEVYQDIVTLLHDSSNPMHHSIKQIIDYYEKIISCMPGNVYWLDKDCRSIGGNKNVLDLFGLKNSDDFCGLTFEDQARLGGWSRRQEELFKKDSESVIRAGVEKANIEEPPIPGPDGQDIYFLTTRVPLFNENGHVIGMVGISTDITAHKQAQAALKKAEGKVDGMMLVGASMAHELRTPLAGVKSALYGIENSLPTIIAGYEQAAQNNLVEPKLSMQYLATLQEVVTNIGKKVDHCNTVINMLLTNLAHNQINSADFEQCSIKKCVDQALDKYTFAAGHYDLIKKNIQNDFYFFGKEMLIVHIIFNLLKNALYFIQKAGKGDIKIWVETAESGNSLHFKDTGQGILEDNLPYIFDQFFTKDTYHGAGIGLAFSKMVMEAHRGSIQCHSKYGEYTEFILTFPVIDNNRI